MVEYREATRLYAESVLDLTEAVRLGLTDDTESLRRTCRTAWEVSERARVALALHEGRHYCDCKDFSE